MILGGIINETEPEEAKSPVIILGGIYGGFCTATEAAGISAIYAAFVGVVIYRELDWKGILNACSATARSCGEILVLVAAAQALGWMLTRGQVPQIVTSFIAANIHSKISTNSVRT